eukprot:516570-Rhodomonas_salina.2
MMLLQGGLPVQVQIVASPFGLGIKYAMCGTDIGHAATRPLCSSRRFPQRWCHVPISSTCDAVAVMTSVMPRPGNDHNDGVVPTLLGG